MMMALVMVYGLEVYNTTLREGGLDLAMLLESWLPAIPAIC
jgi:hypothetical protein